MTPRLTKSTKAGKALDVDEHLEHQLLLDAGADQADNDGAWQVTIARRVNEVTDRGATLIDGPEGLEAIRAEIGARSA